nr:unnamed protein product [Callosobruchus chinensis]
MTDMPFCYGMAQGNAHAARRIYHERYPQRAVPAVRTFIRIHARLSETGSFKRSRVVIGRPAIVRTVQMEEAVLNEIERNPETSTRKIAHELNITHVTVWQILRQQQLCISISHATGASSNTEGFTTTSRLLQLVKKSNFKESEFLKSGIVY